MNEIVTSHVPWPTWRKITFRFFFIYLMLFVSPWTWFGGIPWLTRGYNWLDGQLIHFANSYILHVSDTLVYFNGSGDTSYGWTQVYVYVLLALIGCVIWSALDRKRADYEFMDYWLRTLVRFFLAMVALRYGVIKLFAMQMPFPNLSLLTTPLGDLLPMRLSWLFMGYSTQYQVFSGAMETLAGLLLLNRRTVTLGLLLAAGVFSNVVMMNLSYDIPVKIFSLHLLFYSTYLLSYDAKRLYALFILNRPVPGNELYPSPFSGKKMKIAGVVVKLIFIGFAVGQLTWNTWGRYDAYVNQTAPKPIKAGLFEVKTYVLNGDTIPALLTDSLRWKDVVFDVNGRGSVNSRDTIFRQVYRRGYFVYKPDTVTKTMKFSRSSVTFAETPLFDLTYDIPDHNTMKLWGKVRNDSLYVELVRSRRHFQLTERQFHWLSEYNR